MSLTFEILDTPARPALSIRTHAPVGELPQLFGRSYSAITQYLGELGEAPAGEPYAAYYNLDMQDLDLEIGFPVGRELPGRGPIQPSQLPGGKLATCLFVGPYADMAPAYEALKSWIAEQGYEPTGVAYEVYLNDPNQSPPQEPQTRILLPLKAG